MTTTQVKVQLPEETEVANAFFEERMVAQGISRYEEKKTKAQKIGELTNPEMRLLEEAVTATADFITNMINDAHEERKARGGRGRMAGWVFPLSLVDPKVLAYAALNECFVVVARSGEERKLVKVIGQAVEQELWAKNLQTYQPDLYERLVKMACKNHDRRDYRLTAVKHVATKEGFVVDKWDEEYCLTVGNALLNAVLMATNLFERYSYDEEQNNTMNCIGFTKEAAERLNGLHMRQSLARPVFLPLLTPPKPWTSLRSGGYYHESLQVDLVRTFDRNHKKALKEAIENGQMEGVLNAVNTMGQVPQAINQPVLDALQFVVDNEISIEGLPSWDYYLMPPKVHPVKWRIMPMEEKKRWKKLRQEILIKNRSLESQWELLKQDLGIANDLRGNTFYQAYTIDKRGRVYAVSHHNHTRSDHIRNLFQFANGKPLGYSGAIWLAIHVASTGDFKDAEGAKVSKKSFADRTQWTLDNTEMIEKIGNDPKGTVDLWKTADKPFGFLAACIAWAGYKREGVDYVCHLPIPLDGSNSGLQHYCAALRSEEGKYVNLKHSPTPEDIYAYVAQKCFLQAQQDISNPEKAKVAQLWLSYGIGRSEVKRSVMTFAYSSPKFGFRQQLLEDLMEPLRDKVLQMGAFQGSTEDKEKEAKALKLLMVGEDAVHPFGNEDTQREAAGYMAGLIWDAVNAVVSKASEGMKFLQDCAALLAHEGKPVNWVTPLGMPVQNMYEEYDQKRVELFLYDRKVKVHEANEGDKITNDGEGVLKRVQTTLRTNTTGKVIKTKMKSTVSPNFIHSMDACHLQTTVNYAVDAGITDLLLIHDSFSTHACDTSRFQMIIKQAFVDMYENNDVFAQFHQRVLEDISEANRDKVPTPPTKGTLDLQEVLESDYAFS